MSTIYNFGRVGKYLGYQDVVTLIEWIKDLPAYPKFIQNVLSHMKNTVDQEAYFKKHFIEVIDTTHTGHSLSLVELPIAKSVLCQLEREKTRDGKTTLFRRTAEKGHLAVIEFWLQCNPSFNLLHRTLAASSAQSNHHYQIAQVLDKNIAEVEGRGKKLIEAAAQGDILTIQEVLKDQVFIDHNDRLEALTMAAKHGQLEVVQELLKDRSFIITSVRKQALITAAKLDRFAIVLELLKGHFYLFEEILFEASLDWGDYSWKIRISDTMKAEVQQAHERGLFGP